MYQSAKTDAKRGHDEAMKLAAEHERLGLGVLTVKVLSAQVAAPGGSSSLQLPSSYYVELTIEGRAEHRTPEASSFSTIYSGRKVMVAKWGHSTTFLRVPKYPFPEVTIQLFDVHPRAKFAGIAIISCGQHFCLQFAAPVQRKQRQNEDLFGCPVTSRFGWQPGHVYWSARASCCPSCLQARSRCDTDVARVRLC